MRGENRDRRSRFLYAAGYTVLLAVLTAALFDFYFDLNDDVLIKDILSGVHTGTPSGYSIQMLYPAGVLISLFYRMVRNVDWYGIFLCTSQYTAVFLIAYRSLELLERERRERERQGYVMTDGGMRARRAGLLLLQGLLFYGLFLYESVYVQYTVTCGFLAAAAAFLLYTTPVEYPAKRYLKANLISLVLLTAAFCVRTEMLLLLLPLIWAAGLGKWIREGFRMQARKYTAVIAAAAAAMAAVWAGDAAAHRGADWQEFRRVFDARTQIYDFYGLPEYEEHAEFYHSIGMAEEEYTLLENYNYGVDASIDADRLEAVEAYAKSVYEQDRTFGERFRAALWNYRERLFGESGAPWNRFVIFAYLAVAACLILAGRPGLLWEPALLFAARSVSWFYIEYRGRVVSRITIPLYLMELLLLAGMFWQECRTEESWEGAKSLAAKRSAALFRRKKGTQFCVRTVIVVLAVWSVVIIPDSIRRTGREQKAREERNLAYQALQEYCKENQEHFYYVDVYSTVYFSEKMFGKMDNSGRNYDIIGGWACKSPLSGKEEFRYLITDRRRGVEWLSAYFAYKEPDKTVEKTDEIPGENGEALWEVYSVKRNSRPVEGTD